MSQLQTGRVCGSCRGCCKPFEVPEVGKHDGGWCSKSTERNGCTIYDSRPEACSKFMCVWLYGLGEESDRPDILGVVIVPKEDTLHFWEIEPGSLNKPRIRQIADANKANGFAVHYHFMVGEDCYLLQIG